MGSLLISEREKVTEVVPATQKLPNPSYTHTLDNKLTQLRCLSGSCLNYADGTEKAFDAWLLCLTGFHTASVQKHGTTEAVGEANVSLKLQAKVESSFKVKKVESMKKAADVMLKSLNKAGVAQDLQCKMSNTGVWLWTA